MPLYQPCLALIQLYLKSIPSSNIAACFWCDVSIYLLFRFFRLLLTAPWPPIPEVRMKGATPTGSARHTAYVTDVWPLWGRVLCCMACVTGV